MNNFYNAKHYGPKIDFIRQKILFDFGVKCDLGMFLHLQPQMFAMGKETIEE